MAGMTFTFGSGVNDSIFGKSQAPIRMFLESQGELFEQSSPLSKLFNTMHKDVWKVLFKVAEVPPPTSEDRRLSAKALPIR